MEAIELRPYTLDMSLTGYMPLPREILDLELPSTAVLLYGALLDRGTLSQKNRYTDALGRVYVLYTLEHLSETLHISDTAVKRHLRELEAIGLIRRERGRPHEPTRIFLNLPEGSIQVPSEGASCPAQGAKMPSKRVRKVPANDLTEQHNKNNYYQHGEDESL